MRRSHVSILLTLAVLASSPQSSKTASLPSFELSLEFDQDDIASTNGVVVVQSGFASVSASRDTSGRLSGGLGLYKTGELSLGSLGKISVQATTTMDGMYRALLDTELYTGTSSMNPLTIILSQNGQSLEYSGTTDLGYLGGAFIASTAEDTTPKFEVHLNTNGWITATAQGSVQKGTVVMSSYDAGVDLGLISGVANFNGNQELQNYEVGGSLGLVHGSITTDATGTGNKSYRTGVSLGIVSFDQVTESDGTASYYTVLDTGIIRFLYNVNKENKAYWKGTFSLPSFSLNYEVTEEGLATVGGKIQLGSSVIDVNRDGTGHFTVKVDDGQMVQ